MEQTDVRQFRSGEPRNVLYDTSRLNEPIDAINELRRLFRTSNFSPRPPYELPVAEEWWGVVTLENRQADDEPSVPNYFVKRIDVGQKTKQDELPDFLTTSRLPDHRRNIVATNYYELGFNTHNVRIGQLVRVYLYIETRADITLYHYWFYDQVPFFAKISAHHPGGGIYWGKVGSRKVGQAAVDSVKGLTDATSLPSLDTLFDVPADANVLVINPSEAGIGGHSLSVGNWVQLGGFDRTVLFNDVGEWPAWWCISPGGAALPDLQYQGMGMFETAQHILAGDFARGVPPVTG